MPEGEAADPDPDVDAPVWPEMMVRSEAEESLPENEVDEQEEHEENE